MKVAKEQLEARMPAEYGGLGPSYFKTALLYLDTALDQGTLLREINREHFYDESRPTVKTRVSLTGEESDVFSRISTKMSMSPVDTMRLVFEYGSAIGVVPQKPSKKGTSQVNVRICSDMLSEMNRQIELGKYKNVSDLVKCAIPRLLDKKRVEMLFGEL